MGSDPVPALLALVRERPDPRAVTNWIVAYLGKRSARDRRLALQTLQLEFESRQAADPRESGLVLRVIQRLQTD